MSKGGSSASSASRASTSCNSTWRWTHFEALDESLPLPARDCRAGASCHRADAIAHRPHRRLRRRVLRLGRRTSDAAGPCLRHASGAARRVQHQPRARRGHALRRAHPWPRRPAGRHLGPGQLCRRARPSVRTAVPSLSRSIQEAVVGVRVRPGLWVDGGVFFSHIGQESWISRDNPTYTRSFTAEYTPYYSSGVKVTWAASSTLTAQVHLLNGWQNIAENNERKAVGARLDWAPRAGIALGWAGFRGDEQPETSARRMRDFHQLFARLEAGSDLTLWLTADRGWERPESGKTATWGSLTAIAERRLSPTVSLATRLERYVDRDGVLIPVVDPAWLCGDVGVDGAQPAAARGGAVAHRSARLLERWRRLAGAGGAAPQHRGARDLALDLPGSGAMTAS
ncbi:MAG: outer membrane beta-barrel protein [Gemmatimonadales bacterium]